MSLAIARNPQRQFGLMAPNIIRWLLSVEPEVYAAVAAYIEGQHKGVIDVVGPPSLSDVHRHNANRYADVGLPTIRLRCKMTMNLTTGESGVEVTCSDGDLDELMKWPARRAIRQNYLAGQPRIAS